MRPIFIILAALLLCAQASAQTWYEKFDNGGLAFQNGYALIPPNQATQSDRSTAHYKLTAGTTDTNTLNVSRCQQVIAKVYQTSWAGTEGEFYFMSSPDAAKTVEQRITPEINGDGVINAADTVIPFNGEDGRDLNLDGVALQTGTAYGITGVNFFWADVATAPIGTVTYLEVSCR